MSRETCCYICTYLNSLDAHVCSTSVQLQSPSWEWNGELPHVALTILHQHAIQGDVTDLQLAMVRWIAYSKKALELQLDYRILFRLLQDLDQQWNLLTLTKEEVSPPPHRTDNSIHDNFHVYCALE